jgi:hypothetical protein
VKRRHKVIFGIAALIIVAVSLLMGRLTDRVAALEVQYRELIYAKVQGQAGERAPDHPMSRLYRERHDALVEAGYLKTREFPMRRGFESRQALTTFFYSFASNFPGADVQVRDVKQDRPPVIVVCARDCDLLAIKWFIMQQEKGQ